MSLLALSPAVSQAPKEKNSYLRQAEVHETGGTIQVVANSPRPLAQVLDALIQKYGWAVDYEDPQFISKLDLVESAGPGNQTLPGGGRFSVEFPARNPEKEKILQLVVDSYNKSDNPGRFELRKSGQDTFVVVGAQARDVKGQLSHQQALFDTPITIKTGKRSVSDTLKFICQTVAERQPILVTIGVSPRGLLDTTEVEVGGVQVPARELLLQSLALTHRRLYWRLLFDPSSKGYWLDIHLIRG